MHRFVLVVLVMLFSLNAFTQNKKHKQVENAVAALIKSMEDGNVNALNNLAANQLTYGHSGGKVENKQQFVNAFATGASDFVKINISDQTIDVVKKTAIVRHMLEADTNDNNKPGHVKLKILTVWQKMGGKWKLLARQAVKPPVS